MKKGRITAKVQRKDLIKFCFFGVFLLVMLGITIWLLPWILSLKDEAGRAALQEYIHSQGGWGVLILLGIQILQVVIALIPGEAIEIIAGLLYGTFGGYLICQIGMLLGTILVFYLVKWLGASFVHSIVGESKLSRFKFLQDTRRLELFTFILFFIPGTPKDILTYFMPLTRIKPLVFFVITTVARIPSILSSTFAGASISEGKWIQTILIFAVIGLIGIIGICFNNKFLDWADRKKEQIKERHQSEKK